MDHNAGLKDAVGDEFSDLQPSGTSRPGRGLNVLPCFLESRITKRVLGPIDGLGCGHEQLSADPRKQVDYRVTITIELRQRIRDVSDCCTVDGVESGTRGQCWVSRRHKGGQVRVVIEHFV